MIGVVTTARSDYGIALPIVRTILADPQLELHLIVGGMHLAPEFGHTVEIIEADGFAIGDRVETLLAGDSPASVAKSIGLGVLAYAESFARFRPDVLLVIGDRFEMYSAVLAALPFRIPVAHVHGGELTAGAIDDALRHSVTKLSHLHFASTAQYARRIVQLGEEPWRVVVSGAPALDGLHLIPLWSWPDLRSHLAFSFESAPLMVTFHSETLAHERAGTQIDELLAALGDRAEPIVFSLPNADTGGRIIAQRIRAFVASRLNAVIRDNLGRQAYFSLMTCARALVGNSSSGIIEAASFGLPVVNIGQRQAGRVQPRNVIECACERDAIGAALDRVVGNAFRASLAELVNPYGTGTAAATIVARLKAVVLDSTLLVKRFYDTPVSSGTLVEA